MLIMAQIFRDYLVGVSHMKKTVRSNGNGRVRKLALSCIFM